MKLLFWCNRIIEYCFYLLFFLVPLIFTNNTSELFEFNKMWVTFGLTIIIAACWGVKMVVQKRVFVQRTPLDIPIILFLLSQVLSTIFSIDRHISLWGYYSRFNGGLLSTISYILLYYAFVTNLIRQGVTRAGEPYAGAPVLLDEWETRGAGKRQDPESGRQIVKKMLFVSLFSGVIVTLWGLPSHFGFDPTCLLFRGNFDVSCWTSDFQPKIRIFSTLGQPNWLAAYLAILIPIALAMGISKFKFLISNQIQILKFQISKNNLVASGYLLVAILFFLALLYTRSQSGFLAIIISLLIFAGFPIYEQFKKSKGKIAQTLKVPQVKLILGVLIIFILTVFFAGSPIDKLNSFTYQNLVGKLAHKKVAPKTAQPSTVPALDLNITASGKIRSIVWKGALLVWQHYPILGSGVETFAFSYYKYRPVEHNLTSEWNYLYNKAHNEYLNYLATTGILGLGSYLLMIGIFLYLTIKYLSSKKSYIIHDTYYIILALVAGYISILITNFFGFSVVITNLYLFLIPAFVLILQDNINPKKVLTFPKMANGKWQMANQLNLYQWSAISALLVIAFYLLFALLQFWNADKAYYLGSNLDRSGQYQTAYPYLAQALSKRSAEPVFQDEMAVNNAVLASEVLSQLANIKDASRSAVATQVANQLTQNAVQINSSLVARYPNNILFWKSRVRMFYSLSEINPSYLSNALDAIKKAQTLAPTDATISYNLGVLYGQTGDMKNAIKTLEQTIKLRPNYPDAHFALALFYHQQALDKQGNVVDTAFNDKAIAEMKKVLSLSPDDPQAKEALKSWGAAE